MRTTRLMFSNTHRFPITHRVGVIVLLVLLGMSPRSFAVTIDFDDLVPVFNLPFPCFCDNPLTDQYASKGLLISDSYFEGKSYDGGLTYENNMMTGQPNPQLIFTGTLPTYVEMYVTSPLEDAVYLRAFGLDGWSEIKSTPGYAGSDDDPPAIPNYLVSFSSESGIQHIDIGTYYNFRVGASIDNLTYTYAAVPEPSSLALLMIGLVPLTLRGTRNKLETRRNKRR